MRFLALFLLLATTLAAEIDFVTAQGARFVIGQEPFTDMSPGTPIPPPEVEEGEEEQSSGFEYETSAKLLGGVGGVAYADDMLFVADSNRMNASPLNHRVLIYKNISQKWPGPLDEVPQTGRCPLCVGEADVVLGQQDFKSSKLQAPGANTLRVPLGVTSDGVRLAVADTDNNRVLIWNSIPNVNGQPADVVLGQSAFDTNVSTGFNPTDSSLKGPQGLEFGPDGSLWVADSGNNRVLKWNNPRSNGQQADLVLGAPDFTTFVQPDITQQDPDAAADRMLAPVGVSHDGVRLFVADLGYNRVLIWNSIPTQNGQGADIVVGQPDMASRASNNATDTSQLCEAVEQPEPEEGEEAPLPVYPNRCAATLSFPRDVLSDGQKLFIVDGGNDRILIFNEIPTANGARADHVLGQLNEFANNTSDSAFPLDIASPGVMRTPASVAWDGLNLYAADPFNRRVLGFTMAANRVAGSGVRNAASFEIFAAAQVVVGGTLLDEEGNESAVGDKLTITISPILPDETDYTYTVEEGDTFEDITVGLVDLINNSNDGAGDPRVIATANIPFYTVILTSREAGEIGNLITLTTDGLSAEDDGTKSTVVLTKSDSSLNGGGSAAQIAPYTIVSIVGEDLADEEATADASQEELPRELGGVQVYVDGMLIPLLYVSPTQINAQMPVEVSDTFGVSTYVRTVHSDGRVVASNAIAVPTRFAHPGLFAASGLDPRPAVAFHSSSHAIGIVSVDGVPKEGDTAIVYIEGRPHSYTVTEEDANAVECPTICDETDPECEPLPVCAEKTSYLLDVITSALVTAINTDPEVEASASSQFHRIRLRARVQGPAGNGLRYRAESIGKLQDDGTNDSAGTFMSVTTNDFCCANIAGAPVNDENPAIPGEIISFWATGLGLVDPEEAQDAQKTGVKYSGPENNTPQESVSSMIGGRTGNVLHCGIEPGAVGLYRCDLQLNSGLATNNKTPVTIAQGFNVSNIVTISVWNPDPNAGAN